MILIKLGVCFFRIGVDIIKTKVPGGYTTFAMIFAVVAAYVVSNFFSFLQFFIIEDIVTPLLNTLMGLVIAVNIPMIFISIVASICSVETSMLSNVGSKILKRFTYTMLIISVVSVFFCNLTFSVISFELGEDFLSENALEIKKIFGLFLSIIPQSLFAPFADGNILQIVFLAMLVGACIAHLGNHNDEVGTIRRIIVGLKVIIFKLVNVVLKIIPLVIFLCIFKALLVNSPEQILSIWKIVVLNYVLYALFSFVPLLHIKLNYDVGIWDFLKKIYPACLISFTTGSGTASIPKNLEICKNDLKINENLCNLYIPLSHAICPITMLIGILTFTFYAAYFAGVQISLFEVFVIIFLALQFAISAIRADGGMVAIMSLCLAQLGLPLEAIGPIMVANIFLINLSGAISLVIRDCDLIDVSHKVDLTS